MNLLSGFVAALLATVAVAGVDYGLLPVAAIAVCWRLRCYGGRSESVTIWRVFSVVDA